MIVEIHTKTELDLVLSEKDSIKILFFALENSLQCKAYFPIVESFCNANNITLCLINLQGKGIKYYISYFDILFAPTLIFLGENDTVLRLPGLNTKKDIQRLVRIND